MNRMSWAMLKFERDYAVKVLYLVRTIQFPIESKYFAPTVAYSHYDKYTKQWHIK